MDYTQQEFKEFKRLVELGESARQMDRINGRLEMPLFIKKVGRQKCEAMFEVLKSNLTKR